MTNQSKKLAKLLGISPGRVRLESLIVKGFKSTQPFDNYIKNELELNRVKILEYFYPDLTNTDNFVKLLECKFEWDLAVNNNDTTYTTVMREVFHHCTDIPSNRVEFIDTLISILNNHYIDMEEYLIKQVQQIEWEY